MSPPFVFDKVLTSEIEILGALEQGGLKIRHWRTKSNNYQKIVKKSSLYLSLQCHHQPVYEEEQLAQIEIQKIWERETESINRTIQRHLHQPEVLVAGMEFS